MPAARASYVLAGNEKFQAAISQRTAAGPFGAFFLPFLAPGQKLLDCGCGPGSITAGLAQLVAPGKVIGIDRDESAIDAARLNAITSGATNFAFQVADAYQLPFGDGCFDRVFVSSLLEHLGDPSRAAREMLRVLKPGGIAGIGATAGTGFVYPPTPEIDELIEISQRVLSLNGGDPAIGRRLRALLLEAGFEEVRLTATGISNGSAEETKRAAETLIARSFGSQMLSTMREQGWIDDERIARMKERILAWGSHPHATAVTMYSTAVAWKAA